MTDKVVKFEKKDQSQILTPKRETHVLDASGRPVLSSDQKTDPTVNKILKQSEIPEEIKNKTLMDFAKEAFEKKWYMAVLGARICYSKNLDLEYKEDYYTDKSKMIKFLDSLIEKGHLSPFEHININLNYFALQIHSSLPFAPGIFLYPNPNTGVSLYMNLRHFIEILQNSGTEIKSLFQSNMLGDFDKLNIQDPPEVKKLSDKVYVVQYDDDTMSVVFRGITRYTATQILRHRIFSYNQQSLRYTDGSDLNIDYTLIERNLKEKKVDEPKISDFIAEMKTLIEKTQQLAKKYKDLPNEVLRSIYPLATPTNLLMTGPVFSFKHFFIEPRIKKAAQTEIREIAETLNDFLS